MYIIIIVVILNTEKIQIETPQLSFSDSLRLFVTQQKILFHEVDEVYNMA